MKGNPAEIFFLISIWALPAIFAITLHEAAHGYVAWKLGDDTAYRLGRVSFNPLRHIDPMGTIVLPVTLLLMGARFMFGWAKPVPVNFARLNHPRRDMVLVAAAGPGTNLLLALVSGLLMHVAVLFPETYGDWALRNLENSIVINVVLAVFNMLPLPPLDGGRVAVGLLPRGLARPLARLERFGFLIIIGLIFILPLLGHRIGVNLDIFSWLIGGPAEFLYRAIKVLTGTA
jgi:Zn-dependent protease